MPRCTLLELLPVSSLSPQDSPAATSSLLTILQSTNTGFYAFQARIHVSKEFIQNHFPNSTIILIPDLPPDLEKQREEEAAAKELEKNKPVEVKEPTTKEKMIEVKEKLSRVHTQMEKARLEKELEVLAVKWDEERTVEINEKLVSGIPRYGPEAATLKEELEEIKAREDKRKTAKEEEAKKKADKPKTNKAREDKKDGNTTPKKDGKTTPKNKSTENLAPKSETQIKLDKLKERKRMIEEAEKEKNKAAHGHGRHTACIAEAVAPFVPGTSFGKPGTSGSNSRANTASR